MSLSTIKDAVELGDPVLAEKALREIDTLLAMSSEQNERVYLLFSKASCYRIMGDLNEARRQLQLALQEKPDEQTQITSDFMNALILQQGGAYEEAFKAFTKTLTTYPEKLTQPEMRFMYEDIQQRRAFLLVTLSRFNEATKILKEVLSFNLEDHVKSDAFASLGLCHLELQEYLSARNCILEATAIGLTDRWRAEAHFYLGIAYFYTNMVEEAKREFQECERLATQFPLPIMDVYAWLAATLASLGETSESERYNKLMKSQ